MSQSLISCLCIVTSIYQILKLNTSKGRNNPLTRISLRPGHIKTQNNIYTHFFSDHFILVMILSTFFINVFMMKCQYNICQISSSYLPSDSHHYLCFSGRPLFPVCRETSVIPTLETWPCQGWWEAESRGKTPSPTGQCHPPNTDRSLAKCIMCMATDRCAY